MIHCDKDQANEINLLLRTAMQSIPQLGIYSIFTCPNCGGTAAAIKYGENEIQVWCLRCSIVVADSRDALQHICSLY